MTTPAGEPATGFVGTWTVVVSGDATGLAQQVRAGRHTIIADEPLAAGGTDRGPDPYSLLLASLGACTSMTLALYARRKSWPLQQVTVRLRHSRSYPEDCTTCDERDTLLDHIDREIELRGTLDDAQRSRLLEIADRCPVHRTLTSTIRVRTRLA